VTLEDVLEIVALEKPVGVIVQYGGQTPLKLAKALEANGVPIIGTSPSRSTSPKDRERFQHLINDLKLRQPPNRTARTRPMPCAWPKRSATRWLVRPSYVLGGRAMEIVHQQSELERYMREAVKVSNDSPVLLDRFLNDAIEVDVDSPVRRQDRVHRRHHGAHRGSRRAFGRFRLLAAAALPLRRIAGRVAPADRGDGQWPSR